MYVYAKFLPDLIIDEKTLAAMVEEGRAHLSEFSRVPIGNIVETLGRTARLWEEDSPYFRRALDALSKEISFSPQMIRETLKMIPGLLSGECLLKRVTGEFGNPDILDRFVRRKSFDGKVRAFPIGVLFHVTAGNVFLGCIDSLLMGFLTKNVSIMKLSSRNQSFPFIFAESILEADPRSVLSNKFSMIHFPRGAENLSGAVKHSVDAILAWGGDEMIETYKRDLPPGVRLLEYGPKISFQVVFKDSLERTGISEAGQMIAKDITAWDQAACASPQNLFLEEGCSRGALLDSIAGALEKTPLPRGKLSEDECVEILKERYRGKLTSLTSGGEIRQGKDYFLHYDPEPFLRPSPLNRTLIVKDFKNLDDLLRQIIPYSRYLQSLSYLAGFDEKEAFLSAMGGVGVKRFATLGHIMEGMTGAPHDGRFCLLDLVQFVSDETHEDIIEYVNEAISRVPYYRKLRNGKEVKKLAEMPFLDAVELSKYPITESKEFLRDDLRDGYVFSSGGTTGSPKFTFYSHEEFLKVGELLSRGIRAQGLQCGDVVANLFVSGNMWSSFLAIEKALAGIGAIELPIGGTASPPLILDLLKRFRPKAIFALPTHLADLAARSREEGLELSIPYVFYAGEHLNRQSRDLLKTVWKVRKFSSAGYASVDAGPIGYQCAHCKDREHHLFSDMVHMEIVGGEAVVSSKLRKMMPVIRLRTGDRVEWVETPCPCGSRELKFQLLGRIDSQINIWGSRLYLEDIERALADCGVISPVYRVVLDLAPVREVPVEQLTIEIEVEEHPGVQSNIIQETLYEHSKDLAKTHALSRLRDLIQIRFLRPGAIERVARTGKIRRVQDLRE